MTGIIFVGLGGAIGAIGRFLLSCIDTVDVFPMMTLITNVIGAFVIGILTGLFTISNPSQNTVLFWKTGICGGFTTFSTFSLESKSLFDDGEIVLGCAYMTLSLLLCVAAVGVGEMIGKKIAM